MLNQKVKKVGTSISTAMFMLAVTTNNVFATTASDIGLESKSASDVGKAATSKFIGPFKTIGAVLIVFSVMAWIVGLIFANHNPMKRSEVMKTLPWIVGVAGGVGAITTIIGFVLSFIG